MNLVDSASTWLLLPLILLLLAAAGEDMWRMRISNLICAGVAALAVVAALIEGPQLGLWQNLLMVVVILVTGTLLFAAHVMGGGDVKLLAASAMWLDLSVGWKMVVAMAIFGGIETAILLALRRLPWSNAARSKWLLLSRHAGIPYGVAIAGGMLLIIWWFHH